MNTFNKLEAYNRMYKQKLQRRPEIILQEIDQEIMLYSPYMEAIYIINPTSKPIPEG